MKEVYVRKDEIGEIGKFFKKDLISIDELISLIEDLDAKVDILRKKIEDMEQIKEQEYEDRYEV